MDTIDPELLAAFRRAVYENIRRNLVEEEEQSRVLRERTLPRLADVIARARSQGLCRRVWLFGSFAWGQPAERSDIDLLVEDCADPDRLGALASLACERDTHVVPLERAPASLRERVLADGAVL